MKRKVTIMFILLFLLQLSCYTFAQEGVENKVKQNFVKVIKVYLETAKKNTLMQKNKFKEKIERDEDEDYWSVLLIEYSNEFEYDIRKTNSIVSPYIGTVTFYVDVYVKAGKTYEECVKAPWRLLKSKGKTLAKFAYQDGEWIVKGATVPSQFFDE